MGMALGWMALALTAAAGSPDSGRGGVPIKYTVRYMEVDGVGWRAAVFTRLTPVTRQGSATVWTAPQDVAKRLVQQASKNPSASIMQAPKVIAWSGSTAHITTRANQKLVTQVAWNTDDHTVEFRPETVRTGSAATMTGRKLDQGVLVQMVLQDTQVLAVHRIALTGSKTSPSDATANKAAYHVDGCDVAPQCCAAGQTMASAPVIRDDVQYSPGAPEYPWSSIPILTTPDPSERPTTANINQKRGPLGNKRAVNARRKQGLTDLVIPAAAPAADGCSPATACSSCTEDSDSQKVALEVPEIGSQEIVGEWLIPNDGILLVSFGPHTVADKDGKAAVRERLAIIEAEVSAEPAMMPARVTAVAPPGLLVPSLSGPAFVPQPFPSPSSIGPMAPGSWIPTAIGEAGSPPPSREAAAPTLTLPPGPGEMPSPPIPPGTMPPVPSRSIPQGYHSDGKAADLPPLPADDEEDDDDSSESAEPRPSPQTRKPPRLPEPAPEAKPRTSADTAMKKVQFTAPSFPNIPAMFQSAPSVGLQFLVPINSVSLRLPFNRRLELEIFGRVVRNPEPARGTAEVATKPAKDEATTK